MGVPPPPQGMSHKLLLTSFNPSLQILVSIIFSFTSIRNETPPGVSFAEPVPGPAVSCGYNDSPTSEEADSGRVPNLFHLVAIVNNFVFIG